VVKVMIDLLFDTSQLKSTLNKQPVITNNQFEINKMPSLSNNSNTNQVCISLGTGPQYYS